MGGVTPKGTKPAGMHDKSKRPVGHENLHRTKATEESECLFSNISQWTDGWVY